MLDYAGAQQTFEYTGSPQEVVLYPGKYRIECYGACGGPGNNKQTNRGLGGYTHGILKLKNMTSLYIYCGQGGVYSRTNSATYNGGGEANNQNSYGCSGGGATDIRLVKAAWNNVQSLRSRIMVAGGGGGGARYDSKPGDGGGLNGGNAQTGGLGATQTTGNAFGIGQNGPNSNYGKGCGGGGYYGGFAGGASGYYNAGGGGSSFISGLTGCNAIDINGVHTGQSIHYSGLSFEEPLTKSGANTLKQNGYAIITCIQIDVAERTNSNLYKNINNIDSFDFNLLFKDLEV